ncbi:DNA-invertase [Salmonella sp. NCTC 11881]|nr:DNA-invertase [Salmonella sp. NCTC 11881]
MNVGAHFHSLTDSIDTSSAMGRFFFHVMSALAEMERELIVGANPLPDWLPPERKDDWGGRPRAINKHEQETD